jgi:hypothetical protein
VVGSRILLPVADEIQPGHGHRGEPLRVKCSEISKVGHGRTCR